MRNERVIIALVFNDLDYELKDQHVKTKKWLANCQPFLMYRFNSLQRSLFAIVIITQESGYTGAFEGKNHDQDRGNVGEHLQDLVR